MLVVLGRQKDVLVFCPLILFLKTAARFKPGDPNIPNDEDGRGRAV